MSAKAFVSVGECMAELQLAEEGLYSLGFGGDTLNTAWYVRALAGSADVNVEYFTAVGGDQFSADLLAFLKEHEIGTQHVKTIPARNIGLYLISLVGAERHFTYWRDTSAARCLADDLDHLRNSLSRADVIYFSGITLAILEPGHREGFLTVMQDMKAQGAKVVFDSNARRRLWPSEEVMKQSMIEGYKAATLAMPTFDDDRALFGDTSPEDCARRVASYGVAEIVVKDGANPCCIMAEGTLTKVAPDKVEGIVDTTGAGDSFNAGYMVGRMAGISPVEAAGLAHRVAGRVIRGRGALLDMELFSDFIMK